MDALTAIEPVLGTGKKTSSDEYLFFCPFCYHHKPKLSVNVGRHIGYWKCWVCGMAGRTINSLLYQMNIPKRDRSSILTAFGNRYIPRDEDDQYESLRLPKEYKPIWEPVTGWEWKNASAFLKRRGLTREDIIKHRIGFCDSGDFKGRVIIPSFNSDSKLNYFVARCYYDDGLKYKNPPASKNTIIFEDTIDWTQPIVLVEGVFDAISVRRNSIPLLGKVLYDSVKRMLITKRPPMTYIMMDADAKKDAMLMEKWLVAHGLNVKFVGMDMKDASDMGFQASWDHIHQAQESSFSDLVRSIME